MRTIYSSRFTTQRPNGELAIDFSSCGDWFIYRPAAGFKHWDMRLPLSECPKTDSAPCDGFFASGTLGRHRVAALLFPSVIVWHIGPSQNSAVAAFFAALSESILPTTSWRLRNLRARALRA